MKVLCLSTALVLSAAGAAHAASLSGSAVGAWGPIDATKGFEVSNQDKGGTADVTWGVEWQNGHNTDEAGWIDTYVANTLATSGPDSSYWRFDGVGSDGGPGWNVSLNDAFSIGTFTYRNGTSYAISHDFKGATLGLEIFLGSSILDFDYQFEVTATTNEGQSAPADADITAVASPPVVRFFEMDGQRYRFDLLGLGTAGAGSVTYTNDLIVFESWTGAQPVSADIYARITTAPIPLPATLPLLLGAIGGMVAFGRRKARAT
ncbi:choice-of-anchor K domain-containing protein [Roseovarius sp.]